MKITKPLIIISAFLTSLLMIQTSTAQEDQLQFVRIPIQQATSYTTEGKTEGNKVSFDQKKWTRMYIFTELDTLPHNVNIEQASLNLDVAECVGVTIDINLARSIQQPDGDFNQLAFSTPNASSELDCLNQLATWDVQHFVTSWIDNTFINQGFIIYGPDTEGKQGYNREFNIESEDSFLEIGYIDQRKDQSETEDATSDRIDLLLWLVAFVLITKLIGLIGYILYLLYRYKIKPKIDSNKPQAKSLSEISSSDKIKKDKGIHNKKSRLKQTKKKYVTKETN